MQCSFWLTCGQSCCWCRDCGSLWRNNQTCPRQFRSFYWPLSVKLNVYITRRFRVTQFQPNNVLTSSACSIILWTHAEWWRYEATEMHVCKLSMALQKLKFHEIMSTLLNYWFMVGVPLSSYGCTWGVAKHSKSLACRLKYNFYT